MINTKYIKCVLILTLMICGFIRPNDLPAFSAKVIGVMDGDTIEVLHDRSILRIRLYGIDTPAQPHKPQVAETQSKIVYHGNVKSKVFHKPDCKYYDCRNCTPNFNSKEAAEKEGYRPCSICSQCHTISKKRTECS